MRVEIKFPDKCLRCGKPIAGDETAQGFAKVRNGALRDDGEFMRTWVYHGKCVPPKMFHRLAMASQPERESPREIGTLTDPAGDLRFAK